MNHQHIHIHNEVLLQKNNNLISLTRNIITYTYPQRGIITEK